MIDNVTPAIAIMTSGLLEIEWDSAPVHGLYILGVTTGVNKQCFNMCVRDDLTQPGPAAVGGKYCFVGVI